MSNAQMDDLIARLDTLDKESIKLIKKALSEPLKSVQKAARAGLASSGINDKNKTIWRAIGRRVSSKGGRIVAAKVGIGVGSKNPRQRFSKGESDVSFAKRLLRHAKGLQSPQAHLLSLGTDDRWTGHHRSRIDKTSKYGLSKGGGPNGKPVMFRGRIKPNPYFKRATQAETNHAMQEFQGTMTTLMKQILGK